MTEDKFLEIQIEKLKEYIDRVLGATLEINPGSETNKSSLLPVYLARGYSFYLGSVQGQKMVFALPREAGDSAAQKLKKDAIAISNVFGFPTIFVFDRLESYQRTRLVQQKVAFTVPGRQLHIPFLVISFTDTPEKIRFPKAERLRPASQVLLLYHFEKERLDGNNFQTIAERITYSPMTVKRAADELHAYGLANIKGQGEKFLTFTATGRDLWEKALPYLNSPVKIDFYISELPPDTKLLRAQTLALSHYTDLAPNRQPEYAIAADDLKEFKKKLKPHDIDYFGGNVHIDVWNYAPEILAEGNTVDRLSLYLSMPRYNLDERTLAALDDLLNNHLW